MSGDENQNGSLATVFNEPKVMLDELSPIPDVELFEDEQTPERLKAIIRHMRRLAGRREMSALFEFVPLPDGGKRFVVTFPEGDERALCHIVAEEVRRAGVEDPAVVGRLNAAYEQVKRAKAVVDAAGYTAFRVGALAGDIIEAFDKLQDADEEAVQDLVEDIRKKLASPPLRPFLQFVDVCRAERTKQMAEEQIQQIREDLDGKGKRRKSR